MPSSQPIHLYFCDKRSHWWKSASSGGSSFCSFCRSAEGKVVALKIQLGMALLVSGFCFLPVTERTTKAKHMQFLSGVSVLVYWLSALVFDFIVFFVSCCLLLVSDRQCFESLFSFGSARKNPSSNWCFHKYSYADLCSLSYRAHYSTGNGGNYLEFQHLGGRGMKVRSSRSSSVTYLVQGWWAWDPA